MNNEYQTYELIDQYLKGELSAEDKLQFETRLQQDALLSETVVLQKAANEAILIQHLSKLNDKLSNDLKHYGNNRISPWMWVSGLFILLSGSAIWWTLSTNNNSSGIIYSGTKNHVKTQPDVMNTQSSSTSENSQTFQPKQNTVKVYQSTSLVQQAVEIKNEGKIASEEITSKEVVNPNPKTNNETSLKILNEKTDPCAESKLLINIETTASCADRPTGKISIEAKNGTPPYAYSLDGKKYSDQTTFLFLKAGQYQIFLRDQKNCLATMNTELSENNCNANQFAFNPSVESWKIPIKDGKSGILEILNRAGQLVYSAQLSDTEENSWDGHSSSGALLNAGYYSFRIRYNDNTMDTGFISIVL